MSTVNSSIMSQASSFQNDRSSGGLGTSSANANFSGNQVTDDPNSTSDVRPVSIFSNDYKKHDDLKQMLDSNKDNLKLEAMRRIVAMIAKGRNASDLFPAVVKNVVSKNVEVKKLVYVYLMRYAEEQQDLALLSISTFQRALKDPNQLIRASALRVLSSIRVPIIVTILLLAIKEAVMDMSPYVRKTAANAITKLYSLDPELKEDLVGIIEKLLADKTILVAGSAIQAFEEVCPERIDLIHKNYRKLCNLLIDVDEWGQVVIINMLTRYARTQFLDPNAATSEDEADAEKMDDTEEEKDDDYDAKFNMDPAATSCRKLMDPDHRLLLRVAKPLLQSRNSAVVMAVAQLYYYVALKSEIQVIAKPLVRLLRSHREVQIVVLKNIVALAQKNTDMFQAHQKSFYVHSNDSIQVKLLKLEILTCLANESNISVILREFQAYVLSHDKDFAAAAIHAIGRCASTIKEVADNCLTGLVNLMSKKDETIVAESVVVIKRLLQLNPAKNGHIIKKMAKMADKVTVPMARASILWLIGEYSDRVNKIAPDVLRKMASTFCDEENIVKLQILNLGVKLYVTNQKQVALLVQYLLNLAKYDQHYDIRDRARFLRALLINNEKCPTLAKHIKKILLAPKPAPVLQSIYKDSDQFQLGTLSHAISARVIGYADLPDFPASAPDPTVRNVEVPAAVLKGRSGSDLSSSTGQQKAEKFYSDDDEDEEKSSQSTEGADPSNAEEEDDDEAEEEEEDGEEEDEDGDEKKKAASDDEDEEEENSESEEEDEEEEDEEEEEKMEKKNAETQLGVAATKKAPKVISDSSEEEEEKSDESSEEEDEEEEEKPKKQPPPKKQEPSPRATQVKPEPPKAQKKPVAEVSLLDLDFGAAASKSPSKPAVASSAVGLIQPVVANSVMSDLAALSSSTSMSFGGGGGGGGGRQSAHVNKREYELLNKLNSNGLQINYRFTRTPHASSNRMTTVELVLSNTSNGDFNSLCMANKKLQAGMSMSDMQDISLLKGATQQAHQIGIDFNDTTQAAQFELTAVFSNDPALGGTSMTKRWPNLSITCPLGELMQPGWSISESEFNKLQAKLKGMNEVSGTVDELTHAQFISRNLSTKLLENVNMCQIPSSQQDIIKYAAVTTTSKLPLMLSLYFAGRKCHLNVNCEKIVLANMFIKEIKQLLTSA